MAKCSLCGAKIRAYMDICMNCTNKMEAGISGFEDNIGRAQFIREMGINV